MVNCIATRCDHFCRTLHVVMKFGLYLHPVCTGAWRVVSTGTVPESVLSSLGVVSCESFTDIAEYYLRTISVLLQNEAVTTPPLDESRGYTALSLSTTDLLQPVLVLHPTTPALCATPPHQRRGCDRVNLRTVIVTAGVHQRFRSRLSPLPLTF